MDLPTRIQFYRDHLVLSRILPGAPKFADIGICVVCQEDFNEASYDMVAIKSCSHIFHRKCIIRWTESWGLQRDTCPSCRAVMYQYVPMTAREIGEMEATHVAEAQGMHAQILELFHEAQRLWLESLRWSALHTSGFYDGPELQEMTDWEDGATTAPVEETPTIAGTISSPQTLVSQTPSTRLQTP